MAKYQQSHMEIIELLKFLQPAETELQTETEIALQKITTVQQFYIQWPHDYQIFQIPKRLAVVIDMWKVFPKPWSV